MRIFYASILLAALTSPCLAVNPTDIPVNTAARVSSTTSRLNCTVDLQETSQVVVWTADLLDTSMTDNVYQGSVDGSGVVKGTVNENYQQYIEADSTKPHDIKIKSVAWSLAGLYQCGYSDIQNPGGNWQHEANLIVLDEIICPEDGVEYDEGDTPAFTCSVNYIGNLKPTIEWWVDGKMVDGFEKVNTDPTPAPPPTPTPLEYVYNFTVSPDHDGAKFECRLHFGTATGAPTYTDSCQTSISVQHGVTDIKIHPDPDNFDGGVVMLASGEHLNCTASGNPAPRYYWTKMEGNADHSIVEGDTLITTDAMLGNNKYNCTAENSPNGQPRTTFMQVHFYVEEGISSSNPIQKNTIVSLVLVVIATLLSYS